MVLERFPMKANFSERRIGRFGRPSATDEADHNSTGNGQREVEE